MGRLKVLVVDDDSGLRFSVAELLAASGGYDVEQAHDGLDAIEKIRAQRYDLVLLDVDMPRLNGLETLPLIKEHDPSIIVIVMTAYATIDDAVRVVKEGAFNYLAKPVKSDELLSLVERALQAQNLISSVAASAPILTEAGRKIIGSTAEMKKVFNIIHRLAKVETPVLIRGASGTGKELVARAIHSNSSRKDGKFVAINCSAIPENLFESELFGHEKGSFTGAHERKIGRFQFAEGGTLFLDELGDMPVMMQVKLLRVLQEKVFVPVGSNREIEANVRVIAATNRPLEQMIQEGRFREDLFYRLNVVPIFLPSLADRRNDLDVLVQNFIRKFNKLHGKRITNITPSAMAVLKRYNWPGNIRELENVIEHAFILENGNQLSLPSLPESVLLSTGITLLQAQEIEDANEKAAVASSQPAAEELRLPAGVGVEDDDEGTLSDLGEDDEAEALEGAPLAGDVDLDFNRQKEAFEKEFIIKALKTFRGRINQTALHANIPKKTLLRKIEKYGINAREFSEPRS